jgi:hypothetical protein
LVVANAALVNLYWVNAGQLTINTLAARHAPSLVFNQALADALGSAIKAGFTTNLVSMMPPQTQLVRVGIRNVAAAAQPEFKDSGAAVPGSAAGDALPPQTAMCLTFRTASAGKSFRGRMYLSGFAETQNDANGRIASAAATAALAFVGSIRSAMTANALTHAVLSRPSFQVVIVETTTFSDGSTQTRTLSRQLAKPGGITDVTLVENRNLFWETQRKRANSRGALPTVFDASKVLMY